MKKVYMGILAILLCLTTCAASAESGRIDDYLFNAAKQTLYCIDTGDYRTASAILGCTDIDSLKTLVAENFTTLGGGMAQTRISVAFFYNQLWYIAVPTMEPASPEVEALLLNCGYGNEFLEAGHAFWGDIQMALDLSEAVIWNEEYAPGVYMITN